MFNALQLTFVSVLLALLVADALRAIGRWISRRRRDQRQRAYEATIAAQRARANDALLAHLPKERADLIRARVDLTIACIEYHRGDLVATSEREAA